MFYKDTIDGVYINNFQHGEQHGAAGPVRAARVCS